jgi:hypothetical protein
MFFLTAFLACTANLTVNGPSSSTIYVVKTSALDESLIPPSTKRKPKTYECEGKGEVTCSVNYFAWDKFYWASYGGSNKTGAFPNEVKILPAIAGIWVWPVWVWAWGPSSTPVEVN